MQRSKKKKMDNCKVINSEREMISQEVWGKKEAS